MKHICTVYKSQNVTEMYLYVLKLDGLKKVPKELLERFGQAIKVMDLLLSEDKKLARTDAKKVIQQLNEKGFYLQMPPPKDEYISPWPEELLHFNDPE